MIDKQKIIIMHISEGKSQRQISRELNISRKTIRRYIRQYEQKKNELLARQKKVIENALKEKDVLMREIHHRVKNNLQVVTSLLNLQSHYIQDEKAFSAVQAGRNRVQSMALIHQFLYREASNPCTKTGE